MAEREARAHSSFPAPGGELQDASTPTAEKVAAAERALADRVQAYTDASAALRAEIVAFSEVLAGAERDPAPPATVRPILKLVEPLPPVESETAEERQTEPRSTLRERLYTDVGGALIGVAGALALINFVFLD